MKLKIVHALLCLGIAAISAPASALSYHDVLGKVFIDDGQGSTSGSYILSVSVQVASRSTVSVGFIHGGIMAWDDPSVPFESFKSSEPFYLMLNCTKKTYSKYPATENAATLRAYKTGTDYKWGDYAKYDEPNSKLVMDVSDKYRAELTKYFKVVCDYTGLF